MHGCLQYSQFGHLMSSPGDVVKVYDNMYFLPTDNTHIWLHFRVRVLEHKAASWLMKCWTPLLHTDVIIVAVCYDFCRQLGLFIFMMNCTAK